MIRLALRDLRYDLLGLGFGIVGLAVVCFAFLLLVPLSLAITRMGDSAGPPQNLIVIERDALQPEQSRIGPNVAENASYILGDRLVRADPVIFRILRIDEQPVQLRGVDQAAWRTTFRLTLRDGSWPTDDSQVVLGLLAAQAGGWQPGSVVSIYGTLFRVAGIADGPGSRTQAVWMSYPAAVALFGPDKGAQLLVVHLAATADPLAARQDLQHGLGALGAGYDVYFEDALLRQYGAALSSLRALSVVLVTIAVVAVSVGAHNLAWLAADERRWLLGVLRTIGFDRGAVARYLVLRAGLITAAAYMLALAAAAGFLRFGIGPGSLSIGTQVQLTLSLPTAALGLGLACAASLIGTWLPVRQVLLAAPADLLGRGPGGTFA